ncbi:MAG: GNAT family N-acetyltransferase [Dehalococcoidia bacterium]|nr:GNAT family N-acetyltransferase [Dehalococcoidia bacterium]
MNIKLHDEYVLRDWPTAWAGEDQARFVALADDRDIWLNLRDRFPHPYTRENAEDWVALQQERDPIDNFAICDTRGPIGSIGLTLREGDLQHSAELGYWLGKPFWGRGIATKAAREVTAYGFRNLGLLRIDAPVHTDNLASVRVLEKAGYQREGLLRQVELKQDVPMDHFLYAILRNDWRGQ